MACLVRSESVTETAPHLFHVLFAGSAYERYRLLHARHMSCMPIVSESHAENGNYVKNQLYSAVPGGMTAFHANLGAPFIRRCGLAGRRARIREVFCEIPSPPAY